MDNEKANTGFDQLFVRNAIESTLRIGLLLVLLIMSYDIIKPFTVPILWGAIIAMAAFPMVKWLEPKLGGRRGLAATLISLLFIVVLVVPTWMVTDATVGELRHLSKVAEAGELKVPPPADSVKSWPVIGEKVYTAWSNASNDLQAFAKEHGTQLREISGKLLRQVGSSVLGVLMFVVSVIIAGGFMAYADSCGAAAHRFFVRVGGASPGGDWAEMVVATVRSVLQGVVGVAVIQTTLVAVGLVVVGVPGAALWSVLVLVLGIAQLPALIITAPIIAYVFSTADTTTAVIFAVYQLAAGTSDAFLRPLLIGRGLDIPMPVILVGAIGGMIASGVIGLFAGAVILSIAYKLFILWLGQEAQ